MEKVKLGIVGLGRLGMQHARNIRYRIPRAELYAACSKIPSEVEAVKQELAPQMTTLDFLELVSLKELDGLIIASNSQAHCEMICGALKAGVKNIYSEKPVGMTLDEIALIRQTAAEYRANIIQVGYNRRFDSNYQRMKQLVDGGKIGQPIIVKMINRDNMWLEENLVKFVPSSGGFIFDMCTHDFDAARWILGSECRSVYAAGDVYKFEGIRGVDIDNVALICTFENGALGVFEASRNSAAGYHMETEVFGTAGGVRVNGLPYGDRLTVAGENGFEQKGFAWFYEFWESTYVGEIAHFADCIADNRQPIVTLEDGCRTVEWAYAANEALRTGNAVTMNV